MKFPKTVSLMMFVLAAAAYGEGGGGGGTGAGNHDGKGLSGTWLNSGVQNPFEPEDRVQVEIGTDDRLEKVALDKLGALTVIDFQLKPGLQRLGNTLDWETKGQVTVACSNGNWGETQTKVIDVRFLFKLASASRSLYLLISSDQNLSCLDGDMESTAAVGLESSFRLVRGTAVNQLKMPFGTIFEN